MMATTEEVGMTEMSDVEQLVLEPEVKRDECEVKNGMSMLATPPQSSHSETAGTEMSFDRKVLLSTMQEYRCCPRCQLRYQNLRSLAVYVNPKPEVINPNSETKEDVVCPLCLGILQGLCDKESLHKLGDDVRSQGFEFNSYIFSMTLPLELLLRKHMFLLFLKESKDLKVVPREVVEIKDVFKWVAGPLMSADLGVLYRAKSPFSVHLTYTNEETEKEVTNLLHGEDNPPPKKKRRKFVMRKSKVDQAPNRSQVMSSLKEKTEEELKELIGCPPPSPSHPCACTLVATYEPIFVAGRYNKLSRSLSQTPWFVNGERMSTSSVQEHICEPMKETFKATAYNFVASGREDVDVKCLGKGRPFAIELSSPHKVQFTTEDMRALQKTINTLTTSIAVRDLQIVKREDTSLLKQGEELKTKDYTALVWVAREVTEDLINGLNLQNLTVKQKTPIRVLQRRSLATRERLIHSISASFVDDHHFKIRLRTQAGTYIKEFVHGDLGRTSPNISSLLNTEADVISLDVEAVNLDWPPAIDDT